MLYRCCFCFVVVVGRCRLILLWASVGRGLVVVVFWGGVDACASASIAGFAIGSRFWGEVACAEGEKAEGNPGGTSGGSFLKAPLC